MVPLAFSALSVIYTGGGGEFLPESRTEGILCWSEGLREGGAKERAGWDENAADTGESFVCRYQNQVQESGAHTGFNIHVMVRKEWNWGREPEKEVHGDRKQTKRPAMCLTQSDKSQGESAYVATR